MPHVKTLRNDLQAGETGRAFRIETFACFFLPQLSQIRTATAGNDERNGASIEFQVLKNVKVR